MEEIWKDIEGYEGFYQVSNLGRVKSLERHVRVGENIVLRKEKIRKFVTKCDGYLHLSLHKEGVKKMFTAHRLVAMSFIPNPEKKETVNHIDGDKTNNNVNNLEWATRKENSEHASKERLVAHGERSATSKLTEDDVKNIRLLYASGGVTFKVLSDYYKVQAKHISSIVKRRHWTHI